MGLESRFNFITDLLDYHILCADDESSIFINENFKNGITGDFSVFRAWLWEERVGLGTFAKAWIVVDIGPKLQKELAKCIAIIARRIKTPRN